MNMEATVRVGQKRRFAGRNTFVHELVIVSWHPGDSRYSVFGDCCYEGAERSPNRHWHTPGELAQTELISDAPAPRTTEGVDWSLWLPTKPTTGNNAGEWKAGDVFAGRWYELAWVAKVVSVEPEGYGYRALVTTFGAAGVFKTGSVKDTTSVLLARDGKLLYASPEEAYGAKDIPAEGRTVGNGSSPGVVTAAGGGGEPATISKPSAPPPKQHVWDRYCVRARVKKDGSRSAVKACVDCGTGEGFAALPGNEQCVPMPGWREIYEANLSAPVIEYRAPVPRHHNYSTTNTLAAAVATPFLGAMNRPRR